MVWINVCTRPRAQVYDNYFGKTLYQYVHHGERAVQRWIVSIGGQPGHFVGGGVHPLLHCHTFWVTDPMDDPKVFIEGLIPDYVRAHLKTSEFTCDGSVQYGRFNITFIDAYTDEEMWAQIQARAG